MFNNPTSSFVRLTDGQIFPFLDWILTLYDKKDAVDFYLTDTGKLFMITETPKRYFKRLIWAIETT